MIAKQTSARPVTSRLGKRRLMIGSGMGALALLAIAQPAYAQNECGDPAGGTVTCTAANNPYSNGVSYIAPPVDLTINVNPDVVIDTTGGLNIGVFGLAVSNQSLTLKGAPGSQIITNADGAFGVLLATNYGAINSTTGIIRTSGTNATGIEASSYTGNITVVAGSTTTTGNNANGIYAINNRGTIVVTTGAVRTSGSNAVGATARSDVGNVTINVGTIVTTGAGSTGAVTQTGFTGTSTISGGSITTGGTNAFGATASSATGAALVNLTSVTTTGTGADAIRVTSTGNTARAIAGTISTTGANARGIVVTGVQGATVNYGTITTTGAGATGIFIPAGVLFFGPPASATATVTGTGRVSTAGANADAINVTATGAASVNTTGAVSTTGANSRGIVIRGGGPVTVSAAGVTTTGTTSAGVVATSTGGSVGVALSGTNRSASADGVTIAAATTATLSLASGSTLGGGANGATITSGTGATVTNAGVLDGTAFALVVNGGAATVTNSGTITGRIQLTDNSDTVTNTGTFNQNAVSVFGAGSDQFINSGTFNANAGADFGTGTDTFTNTGLFRLLAGSPTAATVTFAGLETFTNSGLIELRNGHAGDILSLGGAYSGGGSATLGLDVSLNGSSSATDQLRLVGAASGTTLVNLQTVNAVPSMLNSGTIIVQAGAASNANAFVLNTSNVNQGLVQYGIVYNPVTFAFSLVSGPGAGVYRSSVFAEGVRNSWLQSGDAWSGHMRELRDNFAANGAGGAGGRIWAQALGQVDERQNARTFTNFGLMTSADLSYKQDYFGGQMGVDFGGPAGGGAFAFGITGGYVNSNLNFVGSADQLRLDVVNGGVYASYNSGVFFINALGKYDHYWGRDRNVTGGFTQDMDGSVYGAKAEAGFRLGSTVFIEPSASISYTHADLDDFAVSSGSFGFDAQDGIRGRAGARAGYTLTTNSGTKVSLYAGGNYVHEFKGEDNVAFTSGGQTIRFANRPIGDYGEGTLGLNIGSDHGTISGFMEGRYADGGDYSGYGGRAGIRFRF